MLWGHALEPEVIENPGQLALAHHLGHLQIGDRITIQVFLSEVSQVVSDQCRRQDEEALPRPKVAKLEQEVRSRFGCSQLIEVFLLTSVQLEEQGTVRI